MQQTTLFDPNVTYQKLPKGKEPIGLFISPSQYIQGAGALSMIGEYLSLAVSGGAGVLITPGRDRILGEIIEKSLHAAGLSSAKTIFQGECTDREVARVTDFFRASGKPVGVIVGVGGGKCLDTARLVAAALKIPAATVPTTASTDAPTAAHSVIYHENGVFDRVEFCRLNPLLVLVDLDVIARAPARYLTAGMGDAYSTWFEARCCMENPAALTARGGRPTMGALAIARQCYDVLTADGVEALREVEAGRVGSALARVVEANILLSGIGFESGGLAGAHAVAQGLTVCEELHKNCLHGELVAIGVLAQLVMEKRLDEAAEAARFFKAVGLPLYLEQLGFDPAARTPELDGIIDCSLGLAFMACEPFPVTHQMVKAAILSAGELGKTIA